MIHIIITKELLIDEKIKKKISIFRNNYYKYAWQLELLKIIDNYKVK